MSLGGHHHAWILLKLTIATERHPVRVKLLVSDTCTLVKLAVPGMNIFLE
jgi:hypothetical protein